MGGGRVRQVWCGSRWSCPAGCETANPLHFLHPPALIDAAAARAAPGRRGRRRHSRRQRWRRRRLRGASPSAGAVSPAQSHENTCEPHRLMCRSSSAFCGKGGRAGTEHRSIEGRRRSIDRGARPQTTGRMQAGQCGFGRKGGAKLVCGQKGAWTWTPDLTTHNRRKKAYVRLTNKNHILLPRSRSSFRPAVAPPPIEEVHNGSSK